VRFQPFSTSARCHVRFQPLSTSGRCHVRLDTSLPWRVATFVFTLIYLGTLPHAFGHLFTSARCYLHLLSTLIYLGTLPHVRFVPTLFASVRCHTCVFDPSLAQLVATCIFGLFFTPAHCHVRSRPFSTSARCHVRF
jgi:hypothetical protein